MMIKSNEKFIEKKCNILIINDNNKENFSDRMNTTKRFKFIVHIIGYITYIKSI